MIPTGPGPLSTVGLQIEYVLLMNVETCVSVPGKGILESLQELPAQKLNRRPRLVQDIDDDHEMLMEESGNLGFDIPQARLLKLMKVLYFLSGISAATWGRFGAIYYNEHGISMWCLIRRPRARLQRPKA